MKKWKIERWIGPVEGGHNVEVTVEAETDDGALKKLCEDYYILYELLTGKPAGFYYVMRVVRSLDPECTIYNMVDKFTLCVSEVKE